MPFIYCANSTSTDTTVLSRGLVLLQNERVLLQIKTDAYELFLCLNMNQKLSSITTRYRKIADDTCFGGVENTIGPKKALCPIAGMCLNVTVVFYP